MNPLAADGKLFDAFVSYRSCPEDLEFVYGMLYPRLEQDLKFKLCLHERDFLPGESESFPERPAVLSLLCPLSFFPSLGSSIYPLNAGGMIMGVLTGDNRIKAYITSPYSALCLGCYTYIYRERVIPIMHAVSVDIS